MPDHSDNASTDLNQQSRAAWNENAAAWDDARAAGLPHQDQLIEPAMLRMLGDVNGIEVIDAGCGNGALARKLAALGARVTAFDFAEELIARAQSRSSAHADRIDYRVIDATDAGELAALPAGAFDAVACAGVFMTLAAVEPLIAASANWLKPGGIFVFAVSHPCFNTDRAALVVESVEDPPGHRSVRRAVKVWGYKTLIPTHAVPIKGLQSQGVYFDRSLESLLGAFFAEGFVMDAIEEPAFAADPDAPLLHWSSTPEIPPVFAARMRRRA